LDQFSTGLKMWKPIAVVIIVSTVRMNEKVSRKQLAVDLLGGLPWNLKARRKRA